MARWQVTITGKGIRRSAVEKLAESMKDKFGEERASISVVDDTPPESRADRFGAALAKIEEAKNDIEELKDELQSWYDNLPEGFQNGDKGEAISSAVDELENLISTLDDASGTEVEFPGMY